MIMNKYEEYKKYVKVIFDIITQMLMFKDKSLDNPLFKFLVKNIITETSMYEGLNNISFESLNDKEFFEELTLNLKELSLACEVSLKNKEASLLLNEKIEKLVSLHQNYIIKKQYLN